MRIRKKSPKKEKKAMSVSLYGNLFFVIIEIIMAVYTGSQAVLLDAVYDGIEFLMLLPSIFIIPLLYKPSSDSRPFGYMQFETLFMILKGVTMTAVTIGIIFNNVDILLRGGRVVSFHTVAYFELIAAVLGVIVYVYLARKNRVLQSPLIAVESMGWKIDSVISFGMMAAFLLPALLPFPWFAPVVPYLDPMITVILSMIMLPEPIRTVVTSLRDLMLLPPEEDTILEIREVIEPILEEYGYTDVHHEIVRTGRKLWISTYIVPTKDEMSIERLTTAQTRCIAALAGIYSDFYYELLPEIPFIRPQAAAPAS